MKKILYLIIVIPFISLSQIQIGNNILGDVGGSSSKLGTFVSSSADGNIIAVGAPTDDGSGVILGIVRIYKNENGVWTQIGNDIEGESSEDMLGNFIFENPISLSSDGNIIAIGFQSNDTNGENSGYVRVYKNESGVWTQIGSSINGDASSDRFGASVSLSSDGTIVSIGAPGNNNSSGRVKVYKNQNGTWTQIGSNIDGITLFGASMSLSSDGTIIAIAAPFYNGFTGQVKIYKNENDTWAQIGSEINGDNISDLFGASVSLSSDGSIVAIGASYNDDNGFSSGQVKIYKNENDTWSQVGNNIDGNSGSNSGNSIRLSSDGSIVAIGAPSDNSLSGSAKIYKNQSGVWTQIGSDILGAGEVGTSISLSSDGSIVAVGAPSNDDNGLDSGQVKVYKNESGAWTQMGNTINGDHGYLGKLFGESIESSSDGTVIAVGIPDDNLESGSVKVYKNQSGVWTQIGSDIDGEYSDDGSGASLSLSSDGSIVAIGAPNNDDNGNISGHVRVYKNESGVWTQIGDDINGEAPHDSSGSSLSLSSDGGIVAIGALGNNNVSGHVRVYKNESGVWTQIGDDIDGEMNFDRSGSSVSLSSDGSIVAIGAPNNDGNGDSSGHVRVYKNENDVWTQIGNDIDGEHVGDQSGTSVSMSSDGTIVAIGALYNNNTGNGNTSGHVRVYKNESGVWSQIGNDIDGEVGDRSGTSVSISSDGTIVVVGAPFNSDNGTTSGHVKVYKNQNDSWVQVGSKVNGATSSKLGTSVSISSDGNIVSAGGPYFRGNGYNSGYVKAYSFTSELALLEVIDDILGNNNNIKVTASQLNAIDGVSGAIEGVNYSDALANGTFIDINNPLSIEIQIIIDQVNNSLNIEDNTIKNSIIVYPNPASRQVKILLNDASIVKKVNIYNALGQFIKTSTRTTIDVSSLSKGIYYIEVLTNYFKTTEKLIID